MMATEESLLHANEAGCAYLRHLQLPGGGWSYGNSSFPYAEPTALSLVALGASNRGGGLADVADGHIVRLGLSWLEAQVNAVGAIELPGDPGIPHWSTGLAVWAAACTGSSLRSWQPSIDFLLSWQSVLTESDPAIPLNAALRGWPWYPESFGWVIPTAHAVMALRSSGYSEHARVVEGEALLMDRVCEGGGWNYGNREVLGQVLLPMADTTAWAILALQGRPAALSAIQLGLEFLDTEVANRPTSLSLALTILCFDLHAYPVSSFASQLLARQMDDGSWEHRVDLTALALLALRATRGAGNAFAIDD